MKNIRQTLTLHNHTFVLTGFPRDISIDAYNKARQWLVAHLSKCCHVVSIYEAGTVNQPGISDLDFLVILSVAFSGADASIFNQSGWPDEVNELLAGGTILKTSVPLFPTLNKIDNFKLKLLHGQALQQSKYTENLPFLNLCRLLDWLPERLMSLTRTLVMREINLVHQLGLLKSILLSFRMFNEECGEMDTESNIFDRNINGLRENWFNDEKKLEKVIEYSLQAIATGQEMLKRLEHYVQKEALIKDAGLGNATFRLNDKLCFTFSRKFKVTEPLKLISDTSLSHFAFVIPAGFFPFFAAQSLGEGIISKRLYNNILPAPRSGLVDFLDKKLYQTIHERMDVCNDNAAFLEERSLTNGLLKYGWFLNSGEATDV
jgi:hypothetical protein